MKKLGYGLLGLKPDELFSLTLPEFFDMVNSKMTYLIVEEDKQMERLAWQTSLLMTATGNYGKKGIDSNKLYKRQFDDNGNLLKPEGEQVFTPIDREVRDEKMEELMKKFNKK